MQIDDYIVRLDRFEGPLDLLLYLARKHEVEIADIPLAELTDQYLDHISRIDHVDVDQAGEFLVMAATLLEIKSRIISPPPPGEPAHDAAEPGAPRREEDPRESLIRQLLEYKRFRDAADALDAARAEWERRAPAAPAARAAAPATPDDPDNAPLDLDDLSLIDLAEAFARIIATVDIDRASRGVHEVAYDDTPIELHAEDILDRLRRAADSSAALDDDTASAPRTRAALPLRDILADRPRGEMIGLFLALLELIRRRAVSIRQRADIGVVLALADPASSDAPVADPAANA